MSGVTMSLPLHIGINAMQLSARNSGIGQYIRHMVSSLLSSSEDRFTIYLSCGNVHPEWLGNKNVAIEEKLFRKEQFIRRNIYEISSFGLDLSRANLSLFWAPDAKIPLLMPRNLPLAITVHDLAFLREPETYLLSRVIYWRKIFKLAVEKSTLIVAISNNTKNDLIDLMGVSPEKIRVIYNGVSPRFKPVQDQLLLEKVARIYKLPERFLLFVGLFSPRKNIGCTLKAFKILKEVYRVPHQLVLVGENGWGFREDLRLIKLFGLEKDVVFTGYVADEDLPAVYSLADVFVLPSIYEGFGMPVVEAMACGTPVVTSNTSALAEVVGGSGVLIDPYNPEEIAHKVNLIITDKKLRASLSEAGKERAGQFCWDKAARELIKAFQELA
jgi:glycosyltransferase involved in cell wall biosynthesis